MRLDATLPPPHVVRGLIEGEKFESSVSDLVRRAAAQYGERPAFDFFSEEDRLPNRRMSFRDLDLRVNKLASGLNSAGIRKGAHVGVMLPKVPASLLTWLALARVGAVMVPINTRFTARELEYTLKDSASQWLILDVEYVRYLADVKAVHIPTKQIIVYGGTAPAEYTNWTNLFENGDADFVPTDEPTLDDLATILYTSGTTGFPKGVMLSHRHWLTYARVGTVDLRYLGIQRLLLLHPFYYVAGQAIALFGLFLGATVFVAPHLSTTRFMTWMRETQSQYAFVSHAICKAQLAKGEKYDGIQFLHISYAFTKEMHAQIEDSFGAPLRNTYGMTENALATYMPLSTPDKIGPDCIGIPVPFREVMIADENGTPLRDGGVGEICVRGPGILQGYYNKAEANRTSFFGDWHRSGDRGYRGEDGYFHFLGRMKDMIRRSSENISAAEVETVLLSMPGIERAAVIPVPDDMHGEEVKVYIKLSEGLTQDDVPPAAIFSHCGRNLAAFKIPRFLEYRSELPMPGTADKIEKHVLLKEKADLRVGSYDRIDRVWR